MNRKNPLQSFCPGKASPKQPVKSHLCISKAYSLPPDTQCMRNSLTVPSVLIVSMWAISQGTYFTQILFAFVLWCGFSWSFTSLLLLKSKKAGAVVSAALWLVTAYGVTADGICSMLPNARWHILRTQKALVKLLLKCLQSKPCDYSGHEVTAQSRVLLKYFM